MGGPLASAADPAMVGAGRQGAQPQRWQSLQQEAQVSSVSWRQLVADLIAGFSAPSGYGHNYAVDFVSGWAAVVPPARWTEADSARLQRHLAPE